MIRPVSGWQDVHGFRTWGPILDLPQVGSPPLNYRQTVRCPSPSQVSPPRIVVQLQIPWPLFLQANAIALNTDLGDQYDLRMYLACTLSFRNSE